MARRWSSVAVLLLLLLLAALMGAVHSLPAGRGDASSSSSEEQTAAPHLQQPDEPDEPDELGRLVGRIRRRVIDELGLSHAVVRNTTDDEMEAVMQQYRRLVFEQNRRDSPNDPEEESTIEIPSTALEQGWLVPDGSGSSGSARRQQVLRAAFSLDSSALTQQERISGAALRLWVRGARGRRQRPARLSLYSVTAGRRRRRLAAQLLPTSSGWVSFNVSEAALPDGELRVELRCRRCGRRLAGAAPRLLLRRRRARRVRRETADFLGKSEAMRSGSPVDCANSHDNKCCRQKMEVNFKELGGFDQIIAPASFQAYHCRGGCPASYNVANDHALLQGWIHEKHKQGTKNIPHAHAPCCAPSKLSALPIVHYDAEGKVRITYWENVVVEECRCS